jgi:DNA-binding IscR family transcriptional regulator
MKRMKVNPYFYVALHVMMYAAVSRDKYKLTYNFIVSGINEPRFASRAVMGQLAKAGLIEIGDNGIIRFLKEPEDISMLEMYNAFKPIEKPGIFKLYTGIINQNSFGRKVYTLLTGRSSSPQAEMEDIFRQVSLQQLVEHIQAM